MTTLKPREYVSLTVHMEDDTEVSARAFAGISGAVYAVMELGPVTFMLPGYGPDAAKAARRLGDELRAVLHEVANQAESLQPAEVEDDAVPETIPPEEIPH